MERTYTFRRFNIVSKEQDEVIPDDFQFIGFNDGAAVFVKRELSEHEAAMADLNKEMAELTAEAQLGQAQAQVDAIKEAIAAEEAATAEEGAPAEDTISLETLDEVLEELASDEA